MNPGNGSVLASETVGTLVRLTLLVRLLALGFAIVGVVTSGDRLVAAALFACLVVTSHLGLQRPGVRRLVVRHPSLALPDVVLVSATPLLVGVDNPLVLVSVGTALLVGVLFPLYTAVPLGLLLLAPYAAAAVRGGSPVVDALGFPVVLASVVAMGVAVRGMALEQRRAEEESAQAKAVATAAHERLRLARELHDTVAKSTQGVALAAVALRRWIERDPSAAQHQATMVAEGARAALAAARGLLTSLRLDDPERPLHLVLDDLAARWEADHGGTVDRVLSAVAEPPPQHRHELVCAAGEALENVARHAPGARVSLLLEGTERAVVVTVVDDGPGFPASREEAAVLDGRYGLTGMRERMALVSGRADISSTPGEGTQVRLVVPTWDGAMSAGTSTTSAGGPATAAPTAHAAGPVELRIGRARLLRRPGRPRRVSEQVAS